MIAVESSKEHIEPFDLWQKTTAIGKNKSHDLFSPIAGVVYYEFKHKSNYCIECIDIAENELIRKQGRPVSESLRLE